MKFYNYLKESEKSGITFFDVDETIFNTFAQIKVIDTNGNVIRSLSNQEFNTYELQPGENFDFGEFRDAEFFNKTSKIIRPILAKIKAMSKNSSKMSLLTARGSFPDMETFKRTFRKYGIPIDSMDINMCGDIQERHNISVSEAKKKIIRKYLDTGLYGKVRLVDDDKKNLQTFLSLQREYPDIEFIGFLVDKNGKTKTVK